MVTGKIEPCIRPGSDAKPFKAELNFKFRIPKLDSKIFNI